MSQPEVNQPSPQGGITMERSLIDPNLSNQVQGAFGTTLTGLQNKIGALPGQMQYGGMFNPSSLNLQNSVDLQKGVNLMEASPFAYSSTLDPLVAGQLSGAYQETAEALGAKNKQISDSLRRAPGNNQALISAIQGDNAREAALTSNPYRQNALVAQRALDTEKYGINLQGLNATNAARLNTGNFANTAALQGGEFANQAALAGRSAEEQVAGINQGIMGQNNQFRLSSMSPEMQLMSMMGQGMILTTPRVAGNFTMDDIQRIKDNPELINTALASGLITPTQLAQAGINVNAPTATQYNELQTDYINNLKNQIANSQRVNQKFGKGMV